MTDKRFASGIAWSLTSGVLWSTLYVAQRYLLAEPAKTDPLTLAAFRFGLAGVALGVYAFFRTRRQLLNVSLRDLLYFAVLGLMGVFAMGLLLCIGLKFTPAINASLVNQSAPVFLAILSVFAGERLRPPQLLGIAFGMAGCVLVVGQFKGARLSFETGHLTGDLCIATSAFFWAAYSVASKPIVRRHGGLVATSWAMMFGGLELFIAWLIFPRTGLAGHLGLDTLMPQGLGAWAVIIYLAIFPAAVAFLAWYEAMNRIPLSLLNVMQYLTPVFVIISAYILLGERISIRQVGGMALILLGTVLSGLTRWRPRVR